MQSKLTLAILVSVIGVALYVSSGSGQRIASAQEQTQRPKRNLSLWVPEEELRIWDPMNPNVNPVPWRVSSATADGKAASNFRHKCVGKEVQVEGIAWGYDVKTDLPKSRVIFEGGVVLVKGVDFNQADIHGKCVRVTGQLCLGWMPRQGFKPPYPNFYFVAVKSHEVISKVVRPKVTLKAE